MERMIKDLKDGEEYIFANSPEEYAAFTEWFSGEGAVFAYHFEVGEGFKWKNRIIEVWGL